jgi:hypothetical protein
VGDSLTIGELAARTGVPASTLRYYDRIAAWSRRPLAAEGSAATTRR